MNCCGFSVKDCKHDRYFSKFKIKHWNQYAAENVAAKYSHLFDWEECIAATCGLPIFRLAAINPRINQISVTLPLVLFDPPNKTKRLNSIPYTDSAGILADDWESGRRLLSAAPGTCRRAWGRPS
jgi:hypothetical protein